MKVSTTTAMVTISHKQLFNLFVNAVYGDAKRATGKDRTLYAAFGHLVGISDIDAVRIANSNVEKEDRITVTEFRRGLPIVFSRFAQAMLEGNDAQKA